jgi:hypothetical protein
VVLSVHFLQENLLLPREMIAADTVIKVILGFALVVLQQCTLLRDPNRALSVLKADIPAVAWRPALYVPLANTLPVMPMTLLMTARAAARDGLPLPDILGSALCAPKVALHVRTSVVSDNL